MQTDLNRAKTELERMKLKKLLLLSTTNQLSQQREGSNRLEGKWSDKLMQRVPKVHIGILLIADRDAHAWCLPKVAGIHWDGGQWAWKKTNPSEPATKCCFPETNCIGLFHAHRWTWYFHKLLSYSSLHACGCSIADQNNWKKNFV